MVIAKILPICEASQHAGRSSIYSGVMGVFKRQHGPVGHPPNRQARPALHVAPRLVLPVAVQCLSDRLLEQVCLRRAAKQIT